MQIFTLPTYAIDLFCEAVEMSINIFKSVMTFSLIIYSILTCEFQAKWLTSESTMLSRQKRRVLEHYDLEPMPINWFVYKNRA